MEKKHIYGVFISFVIKAIAPSFAEDCLHDEYKARKEKITSPGYPMYYPPNYCETWYITASAGEIITVSIDFIDIEIGDNGICNRDSLTIGPHNERHLCGRKQRIVYISESRHLSLKFISDHMTSGRGFSLSYISGPLSAKTCLPDEFHCMNGKCIYNKWKCNGADECGDNSDESKLLCNAATEPVPSVSTSPNCGFEAFPCYSNLSRAYICQPNSKLCDGYVDCYGGQDEKNCSALNCNAHYHNLTGFITSPNYPRDYPRNKECNWRIHMEKPTDKIQLRLIDFVLQENKDTDYVIVYDGKDEKKDKVLGKFYGGNPPPLKLESTQNWMTIVFHSDGSFSEKGFKFSFQKKGHCIFNQKPCGNRENDCFEAVKHCDGVWDCPKRGGDELNCGICKVLYSCGPGSSQCYPRSHRCNGVGYCTNMMDELNCSPVNCGPHNGTFLCKNKKCIYETWKCDKTDDCGDNSDEENCSKSTNLIIIAAVAGSLICALLLVVALGCTCKLYNLRMQQIHGPRHETPLSRIYAEFMRRRAPPPYHEAMLTSRSYEEARREYLANLNQTDQTRSVDRRNRRHRRRSSRTRNRESQNNADSTNDRTCNMNNEIINTTSNSTNTETIDNTVNSTNSNIERQSSRTALIPSDSDSESIKSDVGPPASDSVHVHFSEDSGISAQYHRHSRSKDEDSEGLSNVTHVDNSSIAVADANSLDNTTIASCDSVDPPQIDDKQKTSSQISVLSVPDVNPGNTVRDRNNSAGSLDSAGSDTWGDYTVSEGV